MKANWTMVGLALSAGVGIGLLVGASRTERESADAGRPERFVSSARGTLPPQPRSSPSTVSGDSSRSRPHGGLSIGEEARRVGIASHPENCADALQLYTDWAENDPRAAIAQAIDLGEAGGHLRHRVMQVWARQDPAAAAEFFAAHRSSFVQPMGQGGTLERLGMPASIVQAIAREWGAKDPDAALPWARELPEKEAALRAVIGAMAEQAPSLAVDAIGEIKPEDQGPYLNEIAKNWATKDFSEVREWIRQLPAERQPMVLGSALAGLAESDPSRAVQELSAQAPAEVQQRLAGSLARAWSQQDPHAAAEWLKGQDSEPMRAMAAGQVVEVLARKDAQAAWQLVQAMEGGSAYDASLASYIRSRSDENPEKLLDLSSSIRDEAARGQAIALIMAQWSETDPQAAEAFRQSRFSR